MPLLKLPAQPIYQHPVPADAEVPLPHVVDLEWVACTACAHGWQPAFDRQLLEQIYREHYYTPAPDGVGVQFRDDFISALETFGLLRPRNSLLEVGASSGDVLQMLRARTGARQAVAFEPDTCNAALARQRGLTVDERFFGATSAQGGAAADLAYARHVIEHVFDFGDFFAGLALATSADADLVLETPELDHHCHTASLNPFHVEHVHVFSRRSLARLAASHGWRLAGQVTTDDGNLIAWFRRQPGEAGTQDELPDGPRLDGLQSRFESHRSRMRELLNGRTLVFWGAGSAAARLANLIGRVPDRWTDGNPAKVGKRFVGCQRPIVPPEEALSDVAPGGAMPVLVVASSFVREIVPRIRALGWQGEILDLAGKRQ